MEGETPREVYINNSPLYNSLSSEKDGERCQKINTVEYKVFVKCQMSCKNMGPRINYDFVGYCIRINYTYWKVSTSMILGRSCKSFREHIFTPLILTLEKTKF